VALRREVTKYRVPFDIAISAIALTLSYWSDWPTVPYSVVLLAITSDVLAIITRSTKDFRKSLWYIAYIGFLTSMMYVGSDGGLNVIPFLDATVITAVVWPFSNLKIFFWAEKESYIEHETENDE